MDLVAWLRRHGAALQRAAACRDDPWQMDAPGDGPDAKAIADTAVELTAPSPAPLSPPASSPSAAAEAGAGVGADVQLQDPPPAVLDLRPRADFEAGHLPGASHFELHVLAEDEAPPAPPPPSDLRHRSSELPAPAARAALLVLATDAAQAAQAAAHLGHTLQWPVEVMCVAATQDWAAVAAQCGLALERGPYSRPLWQPAPMLRALLPTIEAQLPPAMPRVCVDLGCGGGRDTVFLALRGWRVVAIDQHPRLLQRLQHFATNAGLTAEQQAQRLRLEAHTFGADDDANRAYLQQLGAEEAPALLLCVRFLFRPILDHLLLSLRPRGFLAYEHFVRGCELLRGPKSPKHFFEHGELATRFGPDAGLRVLRDETITIPDGRPCIRFLAQLLPQHETPQQVPHSS